MATQLDRVAIRTGPSWSRFAPDLDRSLKPDLVADPDLLFADPRCEIVKDQRKIKVGRIWLEIGGEPKRIYVKRYNAFSLRYRLFSLFLESPAARAWRGAEMLTGAGFYTGRPIAALEWRSWGMLTRSFYVSEEIPQGKTADAYWREELMGLKGREGYRRRRAFLRRLADLFRGLHQARLYHNDLKDANIIVSPGNGQQGQFLYLLDLEGLRRHGSLNCRRRVKNVVQLHRTMGKCLRRTDKLYWLKVYLGQGFFDRGEKSKWIKNILDASAKRDRRSERKK